MPCPRAWGFESPLRHPSRLQEQAMSNQDPVRDPAQQPPGQQPLRPAAVRRRPGLRQWARRLPAAPAAEEEDRPDHRRDHRRAGRDRGPRRRRHRAARWRRRRRQERRRRARRPPTSRPTSRRTSRPRSRPRSPPRSPPTAGGTEILGTNYTYSLPGPSGSTPPPTRQRPRARSSTPASSGARTLDEARANVLVEAGPASGTLEDERDGWETNLTVRRFDARRGCRT